MAQQQQCRTLPTSTRTDETVSTTLVPTSGIFTTTAPPTFTTHTVSTDLCTTNTTVTPATSVCVPSTSTSIETIPGTTAVLTTSTIIESLITNRLTTTLFTTTCSVPTNPDDGVTTSNPPPTSTPTDITTTTTTTSSTTLANGSVSYSTYTVTTTQAPTPTTQNDSTTKETKSNTGAIVGGAVGGVVGLLALAAVLWYFFKKSSPSRFDDVFDKHDDYGNTHNHQDKGPLTDEVTEPVGKGYQYGLLGHEAGHGGNATGQAPGFGGGGQEAGYQPGFNETGYQPGLNETGYQPGLNETGYQPTGGNEIGYQPSGNETGYQTPGDGLHTRNGSLAPLLGAAGGAAAGAAVYAAATTSSRPSSSGRPSTGGSTQGLLAQNQQQGYGSQALNAYPPQGQGAYYGTEPRLSPNPSVGSSAYSQQSYGTHSQNMSIPLVASAIPPGRLPANFDPENRSGSPVSIQEQRVLQVINPDSSYGLPVGERDSMFSTTGASSSASPPRPLVDGKGRPIDLNGQMVPLVHLDGGRYEEPLVPSQVAGGSAQTGPLPPAYSS
ncbi:hypothetical protein DFP72DRAFT_483205 [Ephemerocybe angulata]|uniref:Uncharacterized protein n=1 Tax=Ephemerocybe angulata TaxID=980116 RepID=A0A8H6IDY4_9AGAR|nr:hypothetical protein DFP72DRAFT_483205 [Tulosesus angulatus]